MRSGSPPSSGSVGTVASRSCMMEVMVLPCPQGCSRGRGVVDVLSKQAASESPVRLTGSVAAVAGKPWYSPVAITTNPSASSSFDSLDQVYVGWRSSTASCLHLQ